MQCGQNASWSSKISSNNDILFGCDTFSTVETIALPVVKIHNNLKRACNSSLNESCMYLDWIMPWDIHMIVVNINLSFKGSVHFS